MTTEIEPDQSELKDSIDQMMILRGIEIGIKQLSSYLELRSRHVASRFLQQEADATRPCIMQSKISNWPQSL